jgi:hypothetical protein
MAYCAAAESDDEKRGSFGKCLFKKARNNFVLSPSMGTELERLKQTYTPVEKILKPPPEERTLLRSFSTNSYNRKGNSRNSNKKKLKLISLY